MEQQITAARSRPDILILALARHDNPYSSTAWSLARAFAEGGRVFFVDNPFTVSDFFKSEKRDQIRKRYTFFLGRKSDMLQLKEPGVKVVVPPLMLPINWLPHGRIYCLLNQFNSWRLKRALNQVLEKHKVKNYIYINSFNPFYGADAAFEPVPAFYIYQTVDDISQSKYVSKHGPFLEQKAMQHADACVATSGNLTKRAASISKNSFCIPNAVDIQLFIKAGKGKLERPLELRGEKRELICYTGSIDHRLDYSLLKEVALTHKDKLLLMIGPVTGNDCLESGFSKLPNVLFTGRKRLEELPAYLQYAHCTIIPFKCNELTASIYPLKINEYLAAGKPVVATPFSEDIRTFQEVIALESKGKEFSEAIECSIRSDSDVEREKRIKVALKNDWQSRACDFYALVSHLN